MSRVIEQLIEEGFLKDKGPAPMEIFQNLTREQLTHLKERGYTRVTDSDGVLYEIRVPIEKIGSLKDEDVSVFEIPKSARHYNERISEA
jgi:hypothetical protein